MLAKQEENLGVVMEDGDCADPHYLSLSKLKLFHDHPQSWPKQKCVMWKEAAAAISL